MRLAHRLFYSRGQPGGLVTFLASPRKVTQRRRPHSAALRYAAGSLRCSPSRAAAELGLSGLRQSSPTSPGLAALLGGRKGDAETNHPIPILTFPLKGKEPLPSLPPGESWREGRKWRGSTLLCTPPGSPSAPPRFSEKIGGRRRGLSERVARVPQPPDLFGKPREARRVGAGGCPYCLVTCILGKQNKVTC